MKKYRKKPVVIEAVQWDGTAEGALPIIEWSLEQGLLVVSYRGAGVLQIDTLGGTMTARESDWIIRGVRGEFYPCKPDIFAATYEEEV